MPRKPHIPAYRLHKPSGQAVVTVRKGGERRDVYLGEHGSPESHREYNRVVAENATAQVQPTPHAQSQITVDALLVAFMAHAREHYRRADGTPTDQVTEFTNAGKPVHRLYGHFPAVDFGPLALATVRQAYIEAGNCRTLINSRVGKIKRIFKWGVSQQLIPVTVFTALTTVAGLEQGRTSARESEPVGPVDPALVDATLPFLNRHVAGLVQFQRLTGCRPGEACSLRQCDIDMSDEVWIYKPPQHKTKHKGKRRAIAIGPKAQELIKGFFTDDPGDYLFSPRRAVEEFRAGQSANRKTPCYPSHMKRNETKRATSRKNPPRERYGRQSYLTAIERACDRAFPLPAELARRRKADGRKETPKEWRKRLTDEERAKVREWKHKHQWFPYQLRHSVATEVRKTFGLEATQVILGRERADVTQTYAKRNEALIPSHRDKAHLNGSTVFRWIVKGVKTASGDVIRLEATRLGCYWRTSLEAVERFSAKLTAAATQPAESTPATAPTPKQQQRAAAKASREADRIFGNANGERIKNGRSGTAREIQARALARAWYTRSTVTETPEGPEQ